MLPRSRPVSVQRGRQRRHLPDPWRVSLVLLLTVITSPPLSSARSQDSGRPDYRAYHTVRLRNEAAIQLERSAPHAALPVIVEALALTPDDAHAWLLKARILRLLGQASEGIDALEHARSLVITANQGASASPQAAELLWAVVDEQLEARYFDTETQTCAAFAAPIHSPWAEPICRACIAIAQGQLDEVDEHRKRAQQAQIHPLIESAILTRCQSLGVTPQ